LDVVLEAFGKHDSLKREQILEIFDHDEPMAAAIVSILVEDDLVAEVGLSEQNYLPVLLVKKPKVSLFLQNGGYTGQGGLGNQFERLRLDLIDPQQSMPAEIGVRPDAKKLNSEQEGSQQHILALQNENLRYQRSIKERDEQITSLNDRVRRLEYLKLLWWLLGILLLVIVVLSYKLAFNNLH
jgi:predicted nucleic acid-binding Zn ribbon protein